MFSLFLLDRIPFILTDTSTYYKGDESTMQEFSFIINLLTFFLLANGIKTYIQNIEEIFIRNDVK